MAYTGATAAIPDLLGDQPIGPHHQPDAQDPAQHRADLDAKDDASSTEKDHGIATSTASEEFDPKDEAAIRRAFDLRFWPVICLLYAFCFLDRINVGNARIAGLERGIGMNPLSNDLNIAVTVFWVFYIISELPSVMLGKKLGLGKYLAALTICFGLVCMCSAFCTNFASFTALRALLGLFEGGLRARIFDLGVTDWQEVPGISFIASRFYRRNELILRLSINLAASALIASFGGLIAAGLVAIPHIGKLSQWQNIFFVEGLLTVAAGIIGVFALVNEPGQATYLSPRLREVATRRIASEYPEIKTLVEGAKWKTTKRGIFHRNVLLIGLPFLFINIAVQGLAVFLPSVVALIFPTRSNVDKQLLSVPPNAIGMVTKIAGPMVATRLGRNGRAPVMLFMITISIIGYAMFLHVSLNPSSGSAIRYAACFCAVAGVQTFGSWHPGWISLNTSPDTTRAAAVSTAVTIGNLGGLISSWTFTGAQAPSFYRAGQYVNLIGTIFVAVMIVVTALYYRWENRQRDLGQRDHRLEGLSNDERELLGSEHPAFRLFY